MVSKGVQKHARDGGQPWVIQPELVEGCTRICSFCGIQAIREKPGNFKYLSMELATKIAEECAVLCPHARFEFAMRGEPLVHPKATEIFTVFRTNLPKAQLMVTTNGDTLRGRMQARLEAIFASGLDFVLLDTYYPGRDALREEALALRDIAVFDFYDDWAPHGISPYHNHGRKVARTVVLMDDLAARDGEHPSRVVKSHAGSNPNRVTPLLALHRNCGRPFREMTIAWNGDVTLCCDDWRHQYVCGNVGQVTLAEIWTGDRFEAARARLYNKDRDFGPCQACDAPAAPRTGLLPRYEQPTPDQLALTAQITAAGAHIIPLWSLKGGASDTETR